MSKSQQGSSDCFGGPATWYRAAQCYDYESSLASFTGAFSLFGMLPVIPGPCGLYRYDAIRGDAVPFYINAVAAHPSECGILKANLNLAEDRVLSYAAALRCHKRAYTAYVPEATFYFEAETRPIMLFTQRRRWINGTVAGYLWLLSEPSIIWRSNIRFWNKPFLTLLLMCQFFMYAAVAISPAIFAISFRWSLPWAGSFFVPQYLDAINTYHIWDVLLGLYCIMYIAFVVWHSRASLKPAVSTIFVHFVTVVNMVAMFVVFAAMIFSLADGYSKGTLQAFNQYTLENWITLLVLFSSGGPILLALLHSPTSFGYMLVCFVPFYLLLPTMVAFIGAYAFARVWDLSWGNRPSEKSSLATTANAAVIKKNAERIKTIGTWIAWIVMFINVAGAILVIWGGQQGIFLVVLALFVFSWSFIQMVFSSIYFLLRNLRNAKRWISYCCCVKLCCCYTEKEWYRRNGGENPYNTPRTRPTGAAVAVK
jgi:chitin synthase